MHSHEPDLVAALAEGTLDSETAPTAEAEISACMRCSADLLAQQAALRAIADIAPARLSPVEAEGLRAAVAEAVNISAVAAPEAPAARRVSWGALGIAAAALMGIVAVVPVLGLLQTGGDDAGSIALDLEQDADDGAARIQDGDEAPTALEAPPGPGEDSVETTAAATTTGAAEAGTGELAEDTFAASAAIEGEEGLDKILEDDDLAGWVGDERASDAQCAEQAIAELGPNAVPLTAPLLLPDGTDLAVYVDLDESRVAAFDAVDCSLRLTRP